MLIKIKNYERTITTHYILEFFFCKRINDKE